MKKRSGIAPLIAIGGILLALSVGSFFLTPDRAFSENENRYLQLTPRLTWDRVMSGDFMEDVEDYTSDQIVFRDFWTAARSVLQRAEGKEDISGTYLGADGRYFAKVTDDSFDWIRLEKNAGYIRDFFAASGKPCTALIVPSPAGILRDMLPENAPYFNEDKAFGRLGDILGGTLLDSRETLLAVDDPYYHTDHHWTTMGAQAAYTLWAQATGHTARSYDLTLATDSFRGTLYSRCCCRTAYTTACTTRRRSRWRAWCATGRTARCTTCPLWSRRISMSCFWAATTASASSPPARRTGSTCCW